MWTKCNGKTRGSGGVGKVSWLRGKSGLQIYMNRCKDEDFLKFKGCLNDWCVLQDGRQRELTAVEVATENTKSQLFRDKKQKEEEEYTSNALFTTRYHAQMLSQRPVSESRKVRENALRIVVQQNAALSNKRFKVDGKCLDEVVKEDDGEDETSDEVDMSGGLSEAEGGSSAGTRSRSKSRRYREPLL